MLKEKKQLTFHIWYSSRLDHQVGRFQLVDLSFDTPGLKRSSLIANITALAQASTRLATAAQFKFPGK